jgi:hypothetical protein
MAATELPVLPTRRALIPGTAMTLTGSDRGWDRGTNVLVLHHDEDERPARVGTVAVVQGVEPIGDDGVGYRVVGRVLMAIEGGVTRSVEDPDDRVGPDEIVAVQRLLRRYLAARAEAGERVDLGVRLSRDPIRASHEVASLLQISWPEVQGLLEAGTARARLRHARRLLERETELLRSFLGRKGTT